MFDFLSDKAMLPGQVKVLIRRNIDRRMPLHEREELLRKGGTENKAKLSDFFDKVMSAEQDQLLADAGKHRAALSYELLVSRLPGLSIKINGLPLTIDNEVTDEFGEVTVEQIPNPQRDGFEEGHVMLVGLPLQIEQQNYDDEGNATTTEMVDNPERVQAQAEYDQTVLGIAKTESNVEIMAVVALREG